MPARLAVQHILSLGRDFAQSCNKEIEVGKNLEIESVMWLKSYQLLKMKTFIIVQHGRYCLAFSWVQLGILTSTACCFQLTPFSSPSL